VTDLLRPVKVPLITEDGEDQKYITITMPVIISGSGTGNTTNAVRFATVNRTNKFRDPSIRGDNLSYLPGKKKPQTLNISELI